ncbi:hypothetical protein CKO28_13395 [Rhodovibrio sodomensis]|uniref:TNase-like domain-containing protein n=2 Tax=Rhodovibrio sodomensis TaxID=1088 RepID=A0ABS1DEY0_9PROT|nr:hypothetical protein [Rhodovibrio sodomensis]
MGLRRDPSRFQVAGRFRDQRRALRRGFRGSGLALDIRRDRGVRRARLRGGRFRRNDRAAVRRRSRSRRHRPEAGRLVRLGAVSRVVSRRSRDPRRPSCRCLARRVGPRPRDRARFRTQSIRLTFQSVGVTDMTFRTLFAAALVAFSASMASAQEVYRGDAEVIDGDTLEVSGERIRLHGIDAPESDQPCYHKGEARMCGRNATQAVRSYLRGKQVACRAHDRDRYGRVIATCYVFENGSMRDLNAAIVESGFAFAYRRYSREYVEEEDVARSKRRGVWKGRTLYPWEYRRGERLAQ